MDMILYGKIVLTCFIKGTSAIVDDSIAVSPRGEALSPREPLVSTAPITNGKLELVVIARSIAIGINNAHVFQVEPIK